MHVPLAMIWPQRSYKSVSMNSHQSHCRLLIVEASATQELLNGLKSSSTLTDDF